MKIVTIVGARPQFIKAAAVSRALARLPGIDSRLVHTGQHYDEDMSDVFFRELAIPRPDHHLNCGSGLHGAQTGRMLEGIERVLLDEKPDWVLVYGDTNSTLAGALAAAKLHMPIAHVEAGLRSFNRRMPEEVNRVQTDHAADRLFAPSDEAVANLRREGVDAGAIVQVGDVMYDAALYYAEQSEGRSTILARLGLAPGSYVLATLHRAENTDDAQRLAIFVEGLARVARERPIVFPLHPRTRAALQREGLWEKAAAALTIIPPLGYLDMVKLSRHAAVIATDSGGVQKEAFFYRVPCVTLREETEWNELIQLGWNELVPLLDPARVARRILEAHGRKGLEGAPYGHGDAAERIARSFLEA